MFRLLVILGCLAVSAAAQQAARPTSGLPVAGSAETVAPVPDATALGALALLPKEVATRVARVEGPDGHPFPERWYVLVHDPAFQTGLREYVFAEGHAVANRGLSQFADRVAAEEVIGAAAVKINSHVAAGMAAQFTMHNGQLLGGIRYELFKLDGSPAWRLTCTSADGHVLGTIVLHATNGSVLSFDGFAAAPPQVTIAAASAAPGSATESVEEETEDVAPEVTAIEKKAQVKSASSKPKPKPKRRVTASRRSSPGPIDRVGNFFRKVFR